VYYVYNTRSDQGCGCKISVERPAALKQSVFSDYFEIHSECEPEQKTCADYYTELDCSDDPSVPCKCDTGNADCNFVTMNRADDLIMSRIVPALKEKDTCCFCPEDMSLLQTEVNPADKCLQWTGDLLKLLSGNSKIGQPTAGERVSQDVLHLLSGMIQEHPTLEEMTEWGYLTVCTQ